MNQRIFFIIFELANFILFVNIILSFVLKNNNKTFSYFRTYLFIAFFFIITDEIIRNFNITNFVLSYCFHLFSFFHFFLLGKYISGTDVLNKNNFEKYFIASISILIIVCSIYDSFYGKYYSATISNVSLIIICISYYLKLLENPPENSLKEMPDFFIVTGVFLGSVLLTPILIFGNYLRSVLDDSNYFLITIIAPLSSILMYLFFIRSFYAGRK